MKKHHPGKLYPNDPCPCGSKKKLKKCCKDRSPVKESFFDMMRKRMADGTVGFFSRVIGKGDEKASFNIEGIQVTHGGQQVSRYDEKISLSVGNSKKTPANTRNVATINLLSNKGKLEAYLAGSGQVSQNKNFVKIAIKNKKILTDYTDKYRVEIKIGRDNNFNCDVFDMQVFLREKNRKRDHINDPHFIFRPDGSGGYLRYGHGSVSIETKAAEDQGGYVLPLCSVIIFDRLRIEMTYLFDGNTLYADNLGVVEI